MKRYFINDEEVTLEQIKKEYETILKLWLLDEYEYPEVEYEYEMNDNMRATTKFLGYEFKIIKEGKS